MESILTIFLTARQNSTLDGGASEVTSSESGGEAAELSVSLFLGKYDGFMDLSDILRFSFLIFISILIFH